jgi:hypothetical protein
MFGMTGELYITGRVRASLEFRHPTHELHTEPFPRTNNPGQGVGTLVLAVPIR